MDVAIVLFDGFDELDAVGPYEVFQAAGATGCDLEARFLTREPTDRVRASHGLRVEPDGVLSEADPDLLVVPGGGWSTGESVGVRREYEAGDLPAAIASSHSSGRDVASVCTGAMLLARAGVLDGRPATTHKAALADLRETGADVRTDRVVDDGDVLTAGGVTAGLDLALHVVERECGAEVADRVADTLAYERVI